MQLSLKTLLLYAKIILGIIFLWYGMLKFFPELSPAEALATQTIDILSFGLLPAAVSIKLLALWEVIVGIGFLVGRYTRIVVVLFLIHMSFIFTPLFLLPELCFTQAPYAFTLVGQYIVKNVLFMLVGIMIYQNEKIVLQ